MKTAPSIVFAKARFIDKGRCIKKGFSPKEEAVAGAHIKREAKSLQEWINRKVTVCRAAPEIAISAFSSKAIVRGDCLKQSGFAGAILADKEGYSRAETQRD